MSFEDLAKHIVEQELNLKVSVHDDGSENGMYDLRIGTNENISYAIECVGAVDRIAIETWNIGPAKGPIKVKSHGNWAISVKNTANINFLKSQIAEIIRICEELSLTDFTPVDWELREFNAELFKLVSAVKITSFHRYETKGSGDVHITLDGGGGPINQSGDELVDWIELFLKDSSQTDVIIKLSKVIAIEKHAFIPIVQGGAPWNVESYFLSSMIAPKKQPNLPKGISGVWVISHSKGIRYSQGKWHTFDC
ncbi:hypothetical protein [Shewanella sp. 10N.286.48.B5]|uniref:hypothetical protein n=1 Tax=Shewanella sp. 10N.286.48.B5 TaxID=1880834 RepID=UPI000C8472D9|nr:hypothetical protein [Shewanella sp. 10N.286.48.B5]PMH89244.1 hypothetical protein BCU57_18625 [Shewanella sp. 10N.286.48.B5]